jgi:hypothetical protein
MTIKGHGFAWFETGTEGTRWCLIDETRDPHSYSSLYELNPGDSLTVYDKEESMIKKILLVSFGLGQ